MIISVFPYIENESVRRLTGDVLSELDRLKCHVYVTKECHAFFSSTAAGGVLVMKLKLLSAYTVITTGMIISP